ncbi:HlyD family efflux transporter periplasmic adaptor subunit [uncultured Lactobacillus sp.]|uniref:HlyD family efflux transporter periplasmic adaptor subunit n=1 Tax=uncultured Lactobacillus sp. TaxID=153152 RepID=UPI00260C3E45|nr:HlyD family efflux transporter periplasmic adaptor subunit [uncultured Lactobacillus sp.]
MNKKYLESSEFYSARFNNFSTMIIVPIFLIFIGVILFSFVGKREITIDSVGIIEPHGSVANVQASVNGKIVYSALKEGRKVKKGQILLKYSSKSNKNRLNLYQIKKANLEDQISGLNLLKKGISSNSDTFNYNDKFGYKNALNNYLDERKTYLLENEQIVKEFKKQNAKKKAKDRKKKLDIQSRYAIKENNQKIKVLQSQELQKVSQDEVNAQEQIQELRSEIAGIHIENKEYVVKAGKTGILHINDNYAGNKYVNPGVDVAQIYPILSKQNFVKLNAYISSTDISSVKKGQLMRFKVVRNVPKPVVISGRISNISVSALNMDKGSYYHVTAVASLNDVQKSQLKYGMNGKVTIITGKKSFFNYYKDKLLGNE